MKKILWLCQLFLLMTLLTCTNLVWGKGNLKGNLDENELDFIRNTIFPILIKSNLCTSTTGDCVQHEFFICFSAESLSCNVYGISDEKIIKEIFLAVLNSGLKVSSFTFWKSRYHETSLFEKPILEFVDRTGGK